MCACNKIHHGIVLYYARRVRSKEKVGRPNWVCFKVEQVIPLVSLCVARVQDIVLVHSTVGIIVLVSLGSVKSCVQTQLAAVAQVCD